MPAPNSDTSTRSIRSDALLATMVMRTHGLTHEIADTLIMHAFAVSYPDESSGLLPEKAARRDAWLRRLR